MLSRIGNSIVAQNQRRMFAKLMHQGLSYYVDRHSSGFAGLSVGAASATNVHTIAHADCIFVIENGAVVEQGRHEDLLRKSGRYASFCRLQLKDQEWEQPAPAVASA